MAGNFFAVDEFFSTAVLFDQPFLGQMFNGMPSVALKLIKSTNV